MAPGDLSTLPFNVVVALIAIAATWGVMKATTGGNKEAIRRFSADQEKLSEEMRGEFKEIRREAIEGQRELRLEIGGLRQSVQLIEIAMAKMGAEP